MTLPTTPSTEADAINLMLDAILQSPEASPETSTNPDTAAAKAILAQVNREVQLKGWHWNTEERYPLPRAVDGTIPLPVNVLEIDTSADFADRDVVQRGVKLYDREKHTSVFTEDLTFDIKFLLPFTDIPEAARNYISLRAARRFQERRLGAADLGRFQAQDEAEALALLNIAENSTGDYNMLSGSWSVARVLNRSANNSTWGSAGFV